MTSIFLFFSYTRESAVIAVFYPYCRTDSTAFYLFFFTVSPYLSAEQKHGRAHRCKDMSDS